MGTLVSFFLSLMDSTGIQSLTSELPPSLSYLCYLFHSWSSCAHVLSPSLAFTHLPSYLSPLKHSNFIPRRKRQGEGEESSGLYFSPSHDSTLLKWSLLAPPFSPSLCTLSMDHPNRPHLSLLPPLPCKHARSCLQCQFFIVNPFPFSQPLLQKYLHSCHDHGERPDKKCAWTQKLVGLITVAYSRCTISLTLQLICGFVTTFRNL